MAVPVMSAKGSFVCIIGTMVDGIGAGIGRFTQLISKYNILC